MQNKTPSAFQYSLLTARLDLLWFPAVFWGLFSILSLIMRRYDNVFDLGRGFLGAGLPLLGGVLAAYATLDDPALELHFAAPRRPSRLLQERLALTLTALTLAALTYQVFLAILGVSLAPLGGLLARQLAWLLPCLALMALGSSGALLLAQPVFGAMLVGAAWIFQALTHGLMEMDPIARYFYLFMAAFAPQHPSLRANQISLLICAALLSWLGMGLIRKTERYIDKR